MSVVVRTLAAGEDGDWDAFVLAHPHGTFFHRTAWRDLVVRFFGHRPEYLVAEADAAFRGVLPLFEVRSPLLGRALISVPYAVYGGALADGGRGESALVDAARERADALDAKYVEFRCMHVPEVELARSNLYCTFLRDLPADVDECLAMIPRKSRAATRHARDRYGMELEEGPALLDAFYDLFVKNKRSLGSPVFSRAYFQDILDRFDRDAMVHGVRHEGRIIAAVISFVFRDTLMPYYSGAEPAAERLGSMNYMYWRLMEEAVKRGLRRYDFGRSRAGTGAAQFKKNMGFEPAPLCYDYILRGAAAIPSVNPSNPKFDVVKNVWSRLPVPLVKALGPRLMRYLP